MLTNCRRPTPRGIMESTSSMHTWGHVSLTSDAWSLEYKMMLLCLLLLVVQAPPCLIGSKIAGHRAVPHERRMSAA